MQARGARALIAGALLVLACAAPSARAQTLAASVNGAPVTTYDVEERIRLRRVLRTDASREAALEELIGERIRFREANRFGGDASDGDMVRELSVEAAALKTTPEALLAAIRKAGVSEEHLRGSLRTRAAWTAYVKARQKGLDAGEPEVRAEIARRARGFAVSVDYVLREITVVVTADAGAAGERARLKEAEALRARFDGCVPGAALAGALKDIVVKPVQTRNSASLSPGLRDIFGQTREGRLTPPQRGPTGYEMIALCEKRASRDDTALREEVRADLLGARLREAGERYFQDLRRAAVIVRR